jgi:hypothetical protein
MIPWGIIRDTYQSNIPDDDPMRDQIMDTYQANIPDDDDPMKDHQGYVSK